MEKNKDLKQKIAIIVCILCVLISAILIVYTVLTKNKKEDAQEAEAVSAVSQEPVVIYQDKIVEKEVEKVITGEILQEGLRDMGLMITEEYDFTEVIDYATTKQFFGTSWSWPGSKSEFILSYDGCITAGFDFEGITVEKDEDAKTITITIPKSEIQTIEIDNDSMKVYSEKESFINQLTTEDFNNGLIELKKNAKTRAIDRGVLDKADENAKTVISNFVNSLIDTSEYEITYKTE